MHHHQPTSLREQLAEVVLHLLNALSATIKAWDIAWERSTFRRGLIVSIATTLVFWVYNINVTVDVKSTHASVAPIKAVKQPKMYEREEPLIIDATSFDFSSDLHHTIRVYYGLKYRHQVLSAWDRVYRRSQQYTEVFDQVADELGIPAVILKGIAARESKMQPHLISPAGAEGLMQVMPSHYALHAQAADWCGDERYEWRNPCHNIYAGALVYKSALHQAEGDTLLALMMYHMGEEHDIFQTAREVGANSFLSVYHAQKDNEKYYALEVMSWVLAFASHEMFGRVQPMYHPNDLKTFTDKVNVASLLTIYPAQTPVE